MNVSILGIPMDLGAGRRGVDMGPSALRNAQLARTLRDLGHSVSMGTVTGNALRGGSPRRTGLIWVDAHTDYNTPDSSPSGNIHGMPVAHLTGLGDPQLSGLGGGWHLQPEDIVMIGIRSVDGSERELLREAGIKAYTMKDVDQLGVTRVTEETLERLADVRRLHVSFDADALDPSVAPGVGTPVPGGLTYREGHLLMELLSESGRVTSLDIVEVNPVLDTRNQTAEVMVGMAASLLGQRIL